jgi:hypothetical protein
VRAHLHSLKKFTYGKHIVARVEKLLSAGAKLQATSRLRSSGSQVAEAWDAAAADKAAAAAESSPVGDASQAQGEVTAETQGCSGR